MRENPWSERTASFDVERRLSWLVARYSLSLHWLKALDSVAAAQTIYRDVRRSMSEADSRELTFLPSTPEPLSVSDFLKRLAIEDRTPAEWLAALEGSLLRLEENLLERVLAQANWESIETRTRAHAHAFGIRKVPASLLSQPATLPSWILDFESPVASPLGDSLFRWERTTARDFRFADIARVSSVTRRWRRAWLHSCLQAVFPGCEIETQDHDQATRFRIQIELQTTTHRGTPS